MAFKRSRVRSPPAPPVIEGSDGIVPSGPCLFFVILATYLPPLRLMVGVEGGQGETRFSTFSVNLCVGGK